MCSVGGDCFTPNPTAGTHEMRVHLRPIERIESTVSWSWSVGLKAACDGSAGFKKIPRGTTLIVVGDTRPQRTVDRRPTSGVAGKLHLSP